MATDKLLAFKKTREIAQKSLVSVLGELLASSESFSEVTLRDKWLSKMRESDKLFDDGWYSPPPRGVSALFASNNDENMRTDYETLRVEEKWPRDDVYFDREHGVMLVYASPVDKGTGIIGDFGMTIYVGNQFEVKKHLQATLRITKEIFDYAKIGIPFSELATFANSLFEKNDLQSDVVVTTATSVENLGHTIPSTEQDWTADEHTAIFSDDAEARNKAISEKRIFVDSKEDHVVAPGIAFTIEPRPKVKSDPTIPMMFFHTVCIFNADGRKEFITGFDEIFKIAGMNYML